MADIVTNFLSWFFPNVGELPEPVMLILGTIFLGLFFGLILRIVEGLRR